MKLASKVIVLLMILLSVNASQANELNKLKLVSIQVTRYEISFQNISKHTLRVIVMDRPTHKSEYFLINPGEVSYFKGNFDKQKLLDLEVMCVYDIHTFKEDISRFQEKVIFKNTNSPNKVLQIKRSEWYKFVDDFVQNRNISDFIETYDVTQLTIHEKTVQELAGDIAGKISKDRTLMSNQGSSDFFASVGLSSAKAAVAVVLELAHNAAEYGYKDQIPYLKNTLEWLSDKRFIQSNRDLIYNVADGLDLRTSTPRFVASFSPIVFTSRINDSWLPPNEVGFDGDKVIGSGWFNNTLALQASAMVTPEFSVINQLAYSRLYASVIYEKISYELSPNAVYQLSSDYLSTSSPTPAFAYTIADVSNIFLETKNIGMSATFKTIINDLFFIDVEAGLLRRGGNFDFALGKEHFVDDQEVINLTYEPSTKVLDKSILGFGKLKAGIGYNTQKGKGIYVTTGLRTFQSKIEPNDNYKIYRRTVQETLLVPTTANKSWVVSLDFGIDVMF